MNNPESIVKNFIEDYFLWNNQSSELTDWNNQSFELANRIFAAEYLGFLKQVESDYKKIIAKYCRPDYQHLGAAFGSESAHHPKNETITSVKTEGNVSIVRTKRLKEIFGSKKAYASDDEFHLIYENDRWYLEQIYFLDEEAG